jgi:tRNA-Thr(GGU) m(6)t(6)A37 methyltransferase TsaA
MTDSHAVRPVGCVRSSLVDRAAAPKQADEGAPPARIEIDPAFAAALDGLAPGADVLVLTWLDRARRDVLTTRPRDDPDRAEQGVFATRSPDRPNPIGLHRVRITAVDGTTVEVDALEALDGTPVLDLKPVLRGER